MRSAPVRGGNLAGFHGQEMARPQGRARGVREQRERRPSDCSGIRLPKSRPAMLASACGESPPAEATLQENQSHSGATKAELGKGQRAAVGGAGSGHQQLPAPDRAACAAGQFPGGGFLFPHRAAGRGRGRQRAPVGRRHGPHHRRAQDLRRAYRHHRVRHVRAIATQAARQATNTGELIARAHAEAGVALEVISPEEEADLAALGCAPLIGRKYQGRPDFRYRRRLDRDRVAAQARTGGWRNASPPRCRWVWSIWRKLMAPRPAAAPASNAMQAAMRKPVRAAGRHRRRVSMPSTRPSAGHIRHRDDLGGHRAQAAALQPRQGGCQLARDRTAACRWWSGLRAWTSPALARIGAIGPERADLMLAGSAIFAAICSLWPSPMLRVADRGLREGMLRQMRDESGAPEECRHERTPRIGARRSPRQSEEDSAVSNPRRASGWSASSTTLMSMPPRRRAIAAAPLSSCWSWTPNSIF